MLPKHLTRWWLVHLGRIGAKLTELSKDQADYINVPVEGPTNLIITTDHDPTESNLILTAPWKTCTIGAVSMGLSDLITQLPE